MERKETRCVYHAAFRDSFMEYLQSPVEYFHLSFFSFLQMGQKLHLDCVISWFWHFLKKNCNYNELGQIRNQNQVFAHSIKKVQVHTILCNRLHKIFLFFENFLGFFGLILKKILGFSSVTWFHRKYFA